MKKQTFFDILLNVSKDICTFVAVLSKDLYMEIVLGVDIIFWVSFISICYQQKKKVPRCCVRLRFYGL